MIAAPEGITFSVDGNTISIKGPKGTITRKVNGLLVNVKMEGTGLTVTAKGKENRKVHAAVNAVIAHVNSAIAGVQNGYEKKLTAVFAHFPVSIEQKGSELLIKNFLGEKLPRKAHVVNGAKVEVKGQEIVVSGIDAEIVGQTASNISKATRITNKDRRIFQDGIYYTE